LRLGRKADTEMGRVTLWFKQEELEGTFRTSFLAQSHSPTLAALVGGATLQAMLWVRDYTYFEGNHDAFTFGMVGSVVSVLLLLLRNAGLTYSSAFKVFHLFGVVITV